MLKSLSIENYAIISHVRLDFDESLNIITGETGAGKSILLGALGLIMGQRSDSKVLYANDSKCIVEATFVNFPAGVEELLEAHDLDSETELIVRREINPSGRSRAFVNDTPTNLEVLQKLSLELVDLNQQFQIIEIQNKNFQLNLVDALADNEKKVAAYRDIYSSYKADQKSLQELLAMESSQLKELDFMKFQLNELQVADLTEGEQAQMESEMLLLEKAVDITALMEETKFKLVDSDNNIKDEISDLIKRWSEFEQTDPEVSEAYGLMIEIQEQLMAIYATADKMSSKVESNPTKFQELRSRLDSIYSLQKKHGVQTVGDLLSIQQDLISRLNRVDNRAELIENLKDKIQTNKTKLSKKAAELSKRRTKVFPELEKAVNKKLKDLSMGSAEIKFSNETLEELNSNGQDDINILFKANKGNKFLPIKKVASGGESARLMLSIKASVAHAMALPTMIFDEIDTGVSGEVAGKMGNILKKLSSQHQLICITHSPQVSARAVKHFFVHKQETKSRTITQVKVLDKQERINEIAKMLSGDPPSTFAIDNAKDLITTI